jgi:signal peptidase I
MIAAILVLAATYAPSLFGYHRYVLVGHSMEPTIHRGSLVFDEVVPVARLHKGDVVTYVPAGLSHPLSHRIIYRRAVRGKLVFRTKGDNNAIADPGYFSFDQPTQARVHFAIPYVGWVYIALADHTARLWLAVLPAILLALWGAASVWRQGGALLEERQAGGAEAS